MQQELYRSIHTVIKILFGLVPVGFSILSVEI